MVYDAMGKLVAEYGQPSDGLGGVKYIQQDWQGSVRTITNNNGYAVARTDHQAFGGEVGYGVGQRSIDQGYNVDKTTRQGYGLTERDAKQVLRDFLAEALDHDHRCVRIVHGKGRGSGPRGPVLKRAVNHWLRQTAAVQAFASARSADGGTGAVYVLLSP